MNQCKIQSLLWMVLIAMPVSGNEKEDHKISFQLGSESVTISIDAKPVSTYVFQDPTGEIKRPYFAHVKTLDGIQVTRNHPPGPGDRRDHATMHPGIWLGFGDISGVDFWRNRGQVQHVTFSQRPTANDNLGSFTQQKRYVDEDGVVVCNEQFRFTIQAWTDAYLLTFDSTFTNAKPFDFGDQEEMGLGIRVATPISEKAGGLLKDATGRTKAKSIWSQSANWCTYGGTRDDHEIGIAIFCHPDNFRESWFHARDYGLLVANPFGRSAMKKGKPSRIKIRPGDSLRVRYGILVHPGYEKNDLDAAYEEFIAQAELSN